MKIGTQDGQEAPERRAPLRRGWLVPAGAAAGVAAVGAAAVAVLGTGADARPPLGSAAGNPPRAADAPDPQPTKGADRSRPTAGEQSAPGTFTLTSTRTTPMDTPTVTKILATCLGADAPRYRAVVAARAPLASPARDGLVVAVDSSGRYVQCHSKGDKGSSQNFPPTFINDRLWGTGRFVEYFDSLGEVAGKGQYLMTGAGHYTADVARITISYGDQEKEYPAVMADGAFAYAAALTPDAPPGPSYVGPSPYVHAYDAAGKKIYSQRTDPQFTDQP
ncbi:hypothetical protein [Streptomyces roseolus]|uniref:hypothetical protein n=1 Tax=Streptomyces roseolus TaxID=67358 RepID=UPI00167B0CD1|nr:hypothetical protein [Streptomyces roseolus]